MLPCRLAGVQLPATICRGGRASEKRQGPWFVVQKASGRSPCSGASNGERGEVQAVKGKCVALRDDSSSGQQAGGGRARAGVRWPRTSVLLAEEGEDTRAPGGLGRELGH